LKENIMSDDIYEDPLAEQVHITEINNSETLLRQHLDLGQIAIENDTGNLGY